jgi:peptide/nickel transport system substrate-binding protein
MRTVKSLFVLAFIGCLSFVFTTATALTPNPVETGTPKYGGVIRYGQIAGPGGYDLHTRPSWSGSPIVPIFNNLVRFNPEYQDASFANLEGDLAERFEVSDNGLVLTFYLRKNVKWHDGEKFDADDVVYSMNKMTDRATGSRAAAFLTPFEKVEKVDDYTIKIYTKFQSPSFTKNLANAYCPILAEHMKDVDPKSTDFLVGTGPFKFKEYIPDSKFTLVRNENYFKKDKAGRQLPYLDGIEIFVVRGSGGTDAFIAKRFQMLNPIQSLQTPEDVEKVRRAAPDTIFTKSSGNVPYLIWLNWTFEPFKNPKVRDAVGLIYRQEDDIMARFGSLDFGKIGPGIFPGSFRISSDEVTKIMGWDIPWKERIKKAQVLMKEAGYSKGFNVRLLFGTYRGSSTSEPSMLVFGDKLQRYLNISYEMKGLESSEMAKVRAKMEWEMFNEMIYSFIPDPDVYAPYFTTGSRMNYTKYSNPEVDKLWELQAHEMNPTKRLEMVNEIERKLLTDHVVLPGAFSTGRAVRYPVVKNQRETGQIYGCEVKFEEVWLDE